MGFDNRSDIVKKNLEARKQIESDGRQTRKEKNMQRYDIGWEGMVYFTKLKEILYSE